MTDKLWHDNTEYLLHNERIAVLYDCTVCVITEDSAEDFETGFFNKDGRLELDSLPNQEHCWEDVYKWCYVENLLKASIQATVLQKKLDKAMEVISKVEDIVERARREPMNKTFSVSIWDLHHLDLAVTGVRKEIEDIKD